ncbi:MAG: Asp-tRNA(Asn)/Glu-tRNA(Gln) amidotransferase subunit GatC [Spirochaetaceae bacterium]|nr:Asp-tRNA(Asn)/Glu-tRNA(Gln) amidotransferase subunit GatC [Spirochaetaceae bacterium]
MENQQTLSEAELEVTAQMARLRLSESERELLRAGVEQILSYFDVMSAADVGDVEPTTHALQPSNRLRPDRVVASEQRWAGASPERLLETAAENEDDHFTVPNVL